MPCIRTGAHIEDCTSVFYFRLCPTSFEPQENVKHFTLFGIDDWFDRDSERYSTLIASEDNVLDHGYNGMEIKEWTQP